MALRVGMLGSGYWAGQVHLPGLAAHSGVTLVGVWGRRAEAAERLGRAFGIPGFSDLEALLDQVEAVAIALPPDIQPGLAIAAARHGCHLLLEKPLALSAEVALEVAEAVEHAGIAQVSFVTRRYVPELTAELARLAAEGNWTRAVGEFRTGAMLAGTPYADCAWRIAQGALWDIGPHALSVLLAVLGQVTDVLACTEADRTTTLRLRHHGGAISETALSLHAARAEWGEAYLFEAAGHRSELRVVLPPRPECYARAIDALLSAIATTGKDAGSGPAVPRTSLRDDAEMVRILAAADALRASRA